MQRVWLVLFAIVSVNSVLLSGCPIAPPAEQAEHGGGNGSDGAGGNGM